MYLCRRLLVSTHHVTAYYILWVSSIMQSVRGKICRQISQSVTEDENDEVKKDEPGDEDEFPIQDLLDSLGVRPKSAL